MKKKLERKKVREDKFCMNQIINQKGEINFRFFVKHLMNFNLFFMAYCG